MRRNFLKMLVGGSAAMAIGSKCKAAVRWAGSVKDRALWCLDKSNVHQSFDAQEWARAFAQQAKIEPGVATDESAMTAWFANALMRGYDEGCRNERKHYEGLLAKAEHRAKSDGLRVGYGEGFKWGQAKREGDDVYADLEARRKQAHDREWGKDA